MSCSKTIELNNICGIINYLIDNLHYLREIKYYLI